MLETLRQEVAAACRMLPQYGLLSFARGSISAFDRANSLAVIVPVDFTYFEASEEKLLVADLFGNIIEGNLNPSYDLSTHIELYRAFPGIGGIVHTHSRSATAWAQAGRDIPPYGAAHAEYFHGYIPCTRSLTPAEAETDYEKNVALAIAETFEKRGFNPSEIPGALVFNHGPYAWGVDCFEALKNAAILEGIADLAYQTEQLNPEILPIHDSISEHQFQKYHNSAKNQE